MRTAAASLALLLAAGCAPAPLFRLTSLDPGARHVRGEAIVRREARGVTWSAGFRRNRPGRLVFDIGVVNRSDHAFTVEPTEFFITLRASPEEPVTGAEPAWSALDPERVLEDFDRLEAQAHADEGTQFLLDAIGGALELADDLAQAGKRTDEESQRDDEEDARQRIESDAERTERGGRVEDLARQRAAWSEGALRRTVLEPGQAIRGWIVFDSKPVVSFVARLDRAAGGGIPARGLSAPKAPAAPVAGGVLVLRSPLVSGQPGMAFVIQRL